MKTIYLVTEGAYSDYRVLCAFEGKADAERFAEVYKLRTRFADSPQVEGHWLFSSGEQPEGASFTIVRGMVTSRGVADEQSTEHLAYEFAYDDDAPRRPKVRQYRQVGQDAFLVEVMCADGDLARKAFRDRAAKLQSELNEPTEVEGA